MSEKVSIIIPVYNTESYLKRCIDSVLHQTYENLEIILVDDGSTDHSLQICIKYEEKDQRIKVLSKKNRGVSAARNTGLEYSTGKYVMFVDSDDWIHTETIRLLYDGMTKSQADMALCCLDYVHDEKDISVEEVSGEISSQLFHREELLCRLAKRSDDIVDLIVVTNKLYKKELFELIKFPENRGYEDEAIIHKLLFQTETALWLNIKLYYYYQRAESTMHQQVSEKIFEKCAAFKERTDFFIEQNLYVSDAVISYLKNLLFTTRLYEKTHAQEKMKIRQFYRHYHREKNEYSSYLNLNHRMDLLYREMRITIGRILFGCRRYLSHKA